MSIPLPELFGQKLASHSKESGLVYAALSTFGDWFEASGRPVFFRDYTEHGARHVASVLTTAAKLIPDSAVDVLSTADVTILTLATLLHDAALHLAEPGFHSLIRGRSSNRMIIAFDGRDWPSLWDEHLFAARRWDDRKLRDVFGDHFVEQGQSVSDPFDRWGDLTQSDCALVGDFIRQHHCRLAHEIALVGVPTDDANPISLPPELTADWRDIAGIVARSHGLPIRHCVDRMASKYHKREYQGIHIIYLMTLLRLADYLQLESSRAPSTVFRFRVIPSIASQLEWAAHNSVTNITPQAEDPESVEVTCEPPNVQVYLRLREWLEGIQAELDMSWAVLGECYGRYESLRRLGLLWRRIRSNLDDRKRFAESVSYVPSRIRMEVARAELLSLLIRPLYGDDPSFGVRELMQNAIDAVRERVFFQCKHAEYRAVDLRDQEVDVAIWLSGYDKRHKCYWLEVSDRGIGMTESIITNYFLKAGASYRHSQQWQREIERPDFPADPNKPKSQVLRSGRFGVGALAMFLIGDEVEVETRHITSKIGHRFRIRLADNAIEVQQTAKCRVGTQIRVRVTAEMEKRLREGSKVVSKPPKWDWYVLDKPSVGRFTGNQRTSSTQRLTIDLNQWCKVDLDAPMDVFFRHTLGWADPTPSLACNGIFVSRSSKLPRITKALWGAGDIGIDTPNLHVSDPDGHLPLGLTRKDLTTNHYGFERELYESVVRSHLAKLFELWPVTYRTSEIADLIEDQPFRRVESYSPASLYDIVPPMLVSRFGFTYATPLAISRAPEQLRRIVFVDRPELLRQLPSMDRIDAVLVCSHFRDTEKLISVSEMVEKLRGQNAFEALRRTVWKTFHKKLDKLQTREVDEIEQSNQMRGRWISHEWERWESGAWVRKNEKIKWMEETMKMPPSEYEFRELISEYQQLGRPLVPVFAADCVFRTAWRPSVNENVISRWCDRLFGGVWIPWDYSRRLELFPSAAKELEFHRLRWRQRAAAMHLADVSS